MPAARSRSSAIHDVGSLVGARLLAAGCAVATTLVVAHAINSNGTYGNYALVTLLAGVWVVIADGGLTTSLARYVAHDEAGRRLAIQVIGLRALLYALAALAMVAFAAALDAGWLGDSSSTRGLAPFALLAALLILAQSLPAFANGLLPTLREVPALAALNLGQSLIELLGVVAVAALALRAEAFVGAAIVAAAAVGVVGVGLALRRTPSRPALVTVRRLSSYGSAVFLVSVCFAVFGAVDQLVIWLFHGSAALAPYALSWRLIGLLALPAVASASVLAPRLSSADADARLTFRRWMVGLGRVYLAAAAVCAVLAPQIFELVGNAYRGGAPVLSALVVYAALMGVAPLATVTANFLGGARQRLRLAAVAVTANLVLDLVLVPPFGAYGAAVATSIAFTFYVGTHVDLTYRLLGGGPWVAGALRLAPRALGVAGVVALAAWAGANAPGRTSPAVAAVLVAASASTICVLAVFGARGALDAQRTDARERS